MEGLVPVSMEPIDYLPGHIVRRLTTGSEPAQELGVAQLDSIIETCYNIRWSIFSHALDIAST